MNGLLAQLVRLYAWAIGLLVAVTLTLQTLDKAQAILTPLAVLMALVILLRLVWAKTRW